MNVPNLAHRILSAAIIVAVTLSSLSTSEAANRRAKADPNVTDVELFAAMKKGDIDVKFIPKDAKQANVLIENKTKKPLRIKLPEAFAAVPILAQFGGGGMGMGGGGMGMGGGGMGMGGGGGQGMGGGMGGGGMGGGGMGGGGMGMGGGFMRVAPEKRAKVAVATVCLEHGKPDPTPKMAYKMIPISEFTKDQRVVAVCTQLGYGNIPQNTAQAVAWHYTDKMSWGDLAAKNRKESKYTGNIPFFTHQELRFAMAIVQKIKTYVDSKPALESESSESLTSASSVSTSVSTSLNTSSR